MFELIFSSYLFLGVISLFFYKIHRKIFRFGFIANAVVSIIGAIYFISHINSQADFTLNGFLFEPSFVLTPLGAFFSFIVCFIGAASAIYSLGYLKNFKVNYAVMSSLFSFFILSMLAVLNSDDVFGFIVLWELMTLVSALMVKFNDTPSSNYSVMLYLGVAQVGAFCMTIAFLIMASQAGSLNFSDWNFSEPSLFVCILLFIGFGTKAGLAPFHVWSPLIYPLANSNISALFSSAMSKVAIFALIKFMLIAKVPAYFALIMMAIGAFGAVWGIIFATLQGEYKKLIAYSSVENMGIILLALGAGLYGLSSGNAILAAFGLAGAILHSLNHSVFKAILFFAAGNVYVASKKLKINSIGGMAKSMPVTAFCALIAVFSVVAIPLFNGFASEWLIYKALLSKTDGISSRLVFAFSTIGLTLAGVLCAIAFMKFYGLVFSGKAKGDYREASFSSLIPMLFLAFFCVVFALISPKLVDEICEFLPALQTPSGTLSFSVLWLCLIGALILPFAILIAFKSSFARPKLSDPWANGYKFGDEFLANSNTVVGDLRRVLAKFMMIKSRTKNGSYSICVKDVFSEYIYNPIISLNIKMAEKLSLVQNGKSATYSLYMVVYLGILAVGAFYFFGGRL